MTNDKSIKILEKYLVNSENNMSAYGKEHLLNKNFYDIYNPLNSGTFEKLDTKTQIKFYLSFIFRLMLYKNELFTKFYKIYKKLAKKQNRLLNFDLIRHAIVLRILNENNVLKGNVCTIGDGKATFVSGLLENPKINKIFSINLPQALIQDYLIIKKYNLIDLNLIKIVERDEDIDDSHKLFLIPAENKKMLIKKDINLFVNKASFQEMPITETHAYLDIIKTNQSYLYSLNREEKKMYDGEIINYYDFKIREKSNKIIFEEQADFYKYFYSLKFPFIHKKQSKIISTLAKF
tara:strand:+ start:120 stop:995 length:876 start_codon:yes stop_codon:yes gene_type:complete